MYKCNACGSHRDEFGSQPVTDNDDYDSPNNVLPPAPSPTSIANRLNEQNLEEPNMNKRTLNDSRSAAVTRLQSNDALEMQSNLPVLSHNSAHSELVNCSSLVFSDFFKNTKNIFFLIFF